jgi:hypothetical protein
VTGECVPGIVHVQNNPADVWEWCVFVPQLLQPRRVHDTSCCVTTASVSQLPGAVTTTQTVKTALTRRTVPTAAGRISSSVLTVIVYRLPGSVTCRLIVLMAVTRLNTAVSTRMLWGLCLLHSHWLFVDIFLETRSCQPSDFRCNTTGRCIPWTWVCDSEADCSDLSDENTEQGCLHPPTNCGQDSFQCLNNRCIAKVISLWETQLKL